MSSSGFARISEKYFEVVMYNLIRDIIDDEEQAQEFYSSENEIYKDNLTQMLPMLKEAFSSFHTKVYEAVLPYERRHYHEERYTLSDLEKLTEKSKFTIPQIMAPVNIFLLFRYLEEYRQSEICLCFTLTKPISASSVLNLSEFISKHLSGFYEDLNNIVD